MAKKPIVKKPVAKKTGIKKKPVAKKIAGTVIRLDDLKPHPYLIKPVSGTRIERYLIAYRAETPSIVLFGGGHIIATLRFYDPALVPKNADTLLYDQAWLHFRREDFANVIDVLRNEGPLYLIHDGGPGAYRIAISSDNDDRVLRIDEMEPVGEGER